MILKKIPITKKRQKKIIISSSLTKSRDIRWLALKIKLQKDTNIKKINKNSQSNTPIIRQWYLNKKKIPISIL